ncbi:MAG: carbohydrate kinase [Chloroflexi bacterium]|nr:carbohydrate kinase [Chloroflexota bacterium]
MIVIAGDALVDLIVRPDGELVPVAGGGSYNTARAAARLGTACSWIGGLSTDRFGRMLEAALVADGVSLDLAQRTELPTTLALAELDEDGAAAYRFYTEGTSTPAVLPGPLAGGLPAGTRAVLTGSLGFVLEPMATTLEAWVAGLPDDVPLMIDPNCRPSITRDPDAYRARLGRVCARADIVKASVEDLAFLRPGTTADEAVAWIRSLGVRVILVTDGGRPVSVHVNGAVHAVPAPPVRVVDTVGAGDTFGGALLACLVHEGVTRATIADEGAVLRATRFAVRASAFVCGRAGADPPTLDELGGWPAT